MKSNKLFIGIDISKRKLDVTFIQNPKENKPFHFVIGNYNESAQTIVDKALKIGFNKEQIFVCFEHTGIYAMPLCLNLQKLNIKYAMVAPLEIYRSKGY